MQYALPHPSRSIAVPLVTLMLGAAGGAATAALLNDDEIIRVSAITPSAQSQPLESNPGPAPDPAAHPGKLGARVSTGSKSDSQGTTNNSFGARP